MYRILLLLGLLVPAYAACLTAKAQGTLFEDLGAQAGIDRIAAGAIELYMNDPRLRNDFDNINPDWLRPRFATFLCHAAGGPCLYKGRSMAASHKGLHITQARFDATVEDLQLAMDRAGIPFFTQNRLLARLAPLERDIVTR
jgi:hemoglobin